MKQRWNTLINWASNFDPAKITFTTGIGILTAIAMLVFIWSLRWDWNIISILVAIALTVFAFFYGKVVAKLIEETYWMTAGEAYVSRSTVVWGWAGLVFGAIMALNTNPNAPTYEYFLNFAIWSLLIWIGPTFPYKILSAHNEQNESPAEHE